MQASAALSLLSWHDLLTFYSPISPADCDFSWAERRSSVVDISSHRPWFDLKLVRLGFVHYVPPD